MVEISNEKRLEKLLEYVRHLDTRTRMYVDILKFLFSAIIASPIASAILVNPMMSVVFLSIALVSSLIAVFIGRALTDIRKEMDSVWGEVLADPKRLPGPELIAKAVAILGIVVSITLAIYVATLLIG